MSSTQVLLKKQHIFHINQSPTRDRNGQLQCILHIYAVNGYTFWIFPGVRRIKFPNSLFPGMWKQSYFHIHHSLAEQFINDALCKQLYEQNLRAFDVEIFDLFDKCSSGDWIENILFMRHFDLHKPHSWWQLYDTSALLCFLHLSEPWLFNRFLFNKYFFSQKYLWMVVILFLGLDEEKLWWYYWRLLSFPALPTDSPQTILFS